LLTIEAKKWLSYCETVVYDRLASDMILNFVPETSERIYVGKKPGDHTFSQEKINALLVEKVRSGKLVARLKGGDPLVFARGAEEAEALRAAGLAFRIVPGVTAALAAGACAGIPLTDRRAASSVTFVTGHEDPEKDDAQIDYTALAQMDTLVFYMGVGRLEAIAHRLIEAGKPAQTPAAIVADAARATQKTVLATLATLAEKAQAAEIAPPAIVIVGEVVRLRERLAWRERLPLFGRTVLVTRNRRQTSRLADALTELGANVIEAPAIEIHPPDDLAPLDAALRRLGEFDWLVLTSPNGAAAVMGRMRRLRLDARALGGVSIAAVGPATADALAEHFLAADLADALIARGLERKKILLARADIAPAALAGKLHAAGATVEEIIAYRTVRPAALPAAAVKALAKKRVDWITFTSSSTVENFLALAGKMDFSHIKLASIGPTTTASLSRAGLSSAVEASPYTIDALVEAIVRRQCEKA
jgi:uroporphyrinogen III methyltransferase/synthase